MVPGEGARGVTDGELANILTGSGAGRVACSCVAARAGSTFSSRTSQVQSLWTSACGCFRAGGAQLASAQPRSRHRTCCAKAPGATGPLAAAAAAGGGRAAVSFFGRPPPRHPPLPPFGPFLQALPPPRCAVARRGRTFMVRPVAGIVLRDADIVLREAGGRNRLSRRHSRASRASSGRSSTSSSGRIDLGTLPFHLIWQKTVPAASTSSFSITCAHPCRELFAGRAAVRGTTLARPFWPRLKALLEGGGGGVSAACARLRCCCFFDRVARFGAYMGLSPSIESTAGSATSCGGCSPTIFCFGVSALPTNYY